MIRAVIVAIVTFAVTVGVYTTIAGSDNDRASNPTASTLPLLY